MKRIYFIALIALLAAVSPASAQSTFMARYATGATASSFGNMLDLGYNKYMTLSYLSDSMYVSVVTGNGAPKFAKAYANTGLTSQARMALTSDGYVFISFPNLNGDSMTLWKMNQYGTVLFARSYHTAALVYFGAMAATDDGGIILGGGGCIGFNYFLRLNGQGDILWHKDCSFTNTDAATVYDIQTTDGRNFRVLAGGDAMYNGAGVTSAYTYLKIDKWGNTPAAYTRYLPPLTNGVCGISSTPSRQRSDYFFAAVRGQGDVNTFLVNCMDTTGAIIWCRKIVTDTASTNFTSNLSLIGTSTGGVIVGCNSGTVLGGGNYSFYNLFYTFDAAGNVLGKIRGGMDATSIQVLAMSRPVKGDTTFMTINNGTALGRIGESLKSFCYRVPAEGTASTVSYQYYPVTIQPYVPPTHTSGFAPVPKPKNVTLSAQYSCMDTVAYSGPAGPAAPTGIVQGAAAAGAVRLYPNPVSGAGEVLHLSLPADMAAADCAIYTIDGRRVMQFEHLSAGEHVLPVQGLAAGVYQCVLSTESGVFATQRLVVR